MFGGNMTSWHNHRFTPKRPHFFQIILEDSQALRQRKLWIPRRFMRDYGREISKHVQVKDPSGRKWKLEWSKRDGEIWFKKGWQEFADFYSLKHGHLLVFEYEGNSHFSLVILDKTATEIKYPIEGTDGKVQEVKKEAEEESWVPFLDDSTPSLSIKRKKSSVRYSPRFPKMLRKDFVKDFKGRGMGFTQKEGSVTGDKKVELRELESKKREKSPLPCPGRPKVGRTGLPSKPESNSKLHTSSSDERGDKSVCCHKHRENRISKNTKVLRDDENAEAFHRACADIKSNHLKNLRRNTSRTSVTQEFATLTSLNKSRALKEVAGFENPSFVVVMKPACVNGNCMPVPFKFAIYHFKEKSGNVILQISERKTWTVGYMTYKEYKVARLSSGWAAFVRDNNLTTGVKCVFELINRAELILNVVIVRASTTCIKYENITGVHPCSPKLQSESSCKQPVHKEKAGRQCSERPSCSLILKVVEAANKFTSPYPSFKASMKSYDLHRSVTVPKEFVNYIKLVAGNELMLQLQVDEKRWPVKFICYPQYKVWKLRLGWRVFSRENCLQVGDICAFELVDIKSLLLKVTIFRCNG